MTNNIRISKSALGLAAVLVISVPLLLVSNVLLARNMSTEDFGSFSFILSVAAIVSIPVTSGLPLLLTREVARYNLRDEWGKYLGIVRSSWVWIAAFSAILLILFPLVGSHLDRLDLGSLNGSVLLWSIAVVPFLSLIAVHGGIIRGFGYPVIAALPAQIIQPSILIFGFLIIAKLGRLNSENAIMWYIFTIAFVSLGSFVVLQWVQPPSLQRFTANYAFRGEWFRSTLSFGAMSAVIILSTNLAILLLGLAGQADAVAYMRVAERGAQLVAFPILMIDGVLAPKLVQTLESDQPHELKQLSKTSARISAIGAAGILVILFIFGKQIISVTFGVQYSDTAYLPMIILAFAQFFYVLTGSPALFLAMAGYEKHAVLGNLIGVSVILLAAPPLIEMYGAVGAAVGVALGMIASKSYLLIMVKRKLRIWAGVF